MIKKVFILLLLAVILPLSVYPQSPMKQMTIIPLKVYIIDPSGTSAPLQRMPFDQKATLMVYYNLGTLSFDEELTPCTLTITEANTGITVFSNNIEKGTGSVEVPLESGRFIVKFEKEGYLYIGNLVL